MLSHFFVWKLNCEKYCDVIQANKQPLAILIIRRRIKIMILQLFGPTFFVNPLSEQLS